VDIDVVVGELNEENKVIHRKVNETLFEEKQAHSADQ
jgi:hypothetical protein